jgi:hypothetical protein
VTYANDCIQIREGDRRRSLKRITDHTGKELNAAIEAASRRFGNDFWLLLHGVDAYMERRRRRVTRRDSVLRDALHRDAMEEMTDIWGNS